MDTRFTRKPMIAATVAALFLGLSACSSDAEAGDQSEEETIPLVVARGGVDIENAVLADEQGFFLEEGLDIGEMQVAGMGGAAQNSAVISGEFDVAATDSVTAIRAVNEGMPIRVVAGTKSAVPDEEREASDGVIVPPDSDISDWSDLEGTKIGVPELGGLPHLATMKGLVENGVDLESIEFVPLPTDALVESAASGQVDAVFAFSIFLLTAVDEGFERVGDGVREHLPHAPQVVWIASEQFTEENPEALERFLSALERGTEYGNENPDAARQAYLDHTELPAPFVEERMVLNELDVTFNKDGWDRLLEVMREEGDLREDLTYEDIVWEGAQ